MTATNNLREVAEQLKDGECSHDPLGRCVNCVESILREVVEEARKSGRQELVDEYHEQIAAERKEARAEAIEECAKVVYENSEGKWGASMIIDKIRALKP